MSEESHLPDLTDAARRTESIVSDQINAILDVVQREADEIRRSADDDAQATRREAMESARRVLERLDALERPLGELVQTLRGETDRLGGSVAVEATAIPAPPDSSSRSSTPSDGASVAAVVAKPEQQAPLAPARRTTPASQDGNGPEIQRGGTEEELRAQVAQKTDYGLAELYQTAISRESGTIHPDADSEYWQTLARLTVEEAVSRPQLAEKSEDNPPGGRRAKRRRSQTLERLAAARDQALSGLADAEPEESQENPVPDEKP